MQIIHSPDSLQNLEADLAIVGAFADEALPGVAEGLIEDGDFKAGVKQTVLLYSRRGGSQLQVNPEGGNQAGGSAVAARRLLLVGLGKRSEVTADRLRQAFAAGAQKAREFQVGHVAIQVPQIEGIDGRTGAQAVA
jgi:leucyl aminopeptidase